MVMARSTMGVTSSVSVALLLSIDGSLVPAGAATLAVLVSEAVPAAVVGLSVPVMVSVTLDPGRTVTGVEITLPEPEAALQVAPAPLAAHVHVTPVMAEGTVSVSSAEVAVDGPALVTIRV